MTKPISENDQIRALFNNLLYVLTHSYYRGEDAHLVEMSKQFIKQMKADFEMKLEAQAKQATEEANKPSNVNNDAVEPVTPVIQGA